jgi:hypothetical protein
MPAANKFVLKGPGVEVDYTIGASPAIPALVFTAGPSRKSSSPTKSCRKTPVLDDWCPSL